MPPSCPDFRLLTSKARAALPAMVSHKDAVYNLSRAALATAAFCDGNYALLGVATKDVLHQQYRLPLITGGDEVFELAQDLGRTGCLYFGRRGLPSWPLCIKMIQSSLTVPRRHWRRMARCITLRFIGCWPITSAQW